MYLKLGLTLFLAIILINVHAQETPAISSSSNEPVKTESKVTIAEVSKNQISSSITVHTYKLSGMETFKYPDNDGNQRAHSASIERMIDIFLIIEGVSRCTFDNATDTFTVLSSPSVNLLSAVRLINNN